MFPPTARQLEALRYIHGYQLANGNAPTLSEIGAVMGVEKWPVLCLLRSLEGRGLIRRTAYAARSIEVLAPPSIPMIGDAPLYFVRAA